MTKPNNPPTNPPAPTYFTDKHAASMELRDYFAAKAMQGLLARIGHDKINVHDALAQRTYQIADAMLKAREA